MFCCCEKDQGGQAPASGMRPPQKGAGWFPSSSSNAMPSKTEFRSVPRRYSTDAGSDDEETGDVDDMDAEEMGAVASENPDADPHDLDDLQSYYESIAAERAKDEENIVEETDSDEDDELREFQEDMKKAQGALQRSCGEEKSQLVKLTRYEHEDPEVHISRKFSLSQLECAADNLQTADSSDSDKETKTISRQVSQSSQLGKSLTRQLSKGSKCSNKGSIKKSKSSTDLVDAGDDEQLNMRYKKKVEKFLKERDRPYGLHDLDESELHEYETAVNDRLAKLSGEKDLKKLPHPKDRAEAVKACVKKYNEECERLGLFKAFSAEDVPEEGLDTEMRHELENNIKTLSLDVKE